MVDETKEQKESIFGFNMNDDKIKLDLIQLEKKYKMMLESQLEKSSHESRISDLEIKMAKLWDLLTDKTPTKKDKPSRFGMSFKEKLRTRR